MLTGVNHVIAIEGGQGDEANICRFQFLGKFVILGFDGCKDTLLVSDQIHFVNGYDDVFDA